MASVSYRGGSALTIKPTRVYLIAGQSNAEGKGDEVNLTGSQLDYAVADANVQYAYEISTPVDGSDTPATVIRTWGSLEPRDSGLFGIELSAGRRLRTRFNDHVRIIKTATTATSLFDDWDSTTSDYGAGSNGLFKRMNTFIDARLAELTGPYSVAGMFWLQGNSDANGSVASKDYAENLGYMVYRLRTKYGEFPVVYDQLHSANVYTQLANVRAEQAALVGTIPSMVMVNADDLVLSDGVHYNETALIMLGERMADAMPEHKVLFSYRGF